MSHGTFCFFSFEGYGWYLSSTASLLYCSYFTHNVVAWLKIRPFFVGPQASFRPIVCKWVRIIYLSTLGLTIPALVFEIYNNFRFFNNISKLYERTRPYEPLMRDPWWVFSCVVFFHVITKCYSLRLLKLIRRSPRFGILLAAIILALSFTTVDILASIIKSLSITDGINPYWKLALVFKCLTDGIMLDDFKSVLQRLGAVKLDGTNAMQTNSLNMSANEKLEVGGDEDEHYAEYTNPAARRMRMSMSGRVLDDGESLDGDGYARRRQSLAVSTVGKVGIKMSKLPGLSFIKNRAEREADRNMKLNKHTSHSTTEEGVSSSKEVSKEEIPPWEQVDFITALHDPEMGDASRTNR